MSESGGGVGGFLNSLVGDNSLHTIFIWQVAAQLIGALMAPFVNEVAQGTLADVPNVQLSPDLLADMVLRGWLDQSTAASEARRSGLEGDKFDLMVSNTGEPPGIMEILELYRRGEIPWDGPEGQPSVTYGIRTSRVRNEWIDAIGKLRYAVPSPGDVVDALVEEQTDRATAEELIAKAGMDPQYLDLLFNTRGRPPGPQELAEMAHRGIIPWTGTGPDALSHQQGIAESAVKTKWTDALAQLSTYLPPPRTVTAMLREGALTSDQAAALFASAGLSQEMSAAYIAAATHQKVAADKQLAKSEIVKLYEDQAIDAGEATDLLGGIGYAAQEAQFLLTIADMTRERKFLESAISRVHTLMVARRLDPGAASSALDTLGVAPGQRDYLLRLWGNERAATVRLLTEAQVVDAWAEGVLDQSAAEGQLEALGYSPHDAWVLLSIKNKGALPGEPPLSTFPSGNIT